MSDDVQAMIDAQLKKGRLYVLNAIFKRDASGDITELNKAMSINGGPVFVGASLEVLTFAQELINRYEVTSLTVPGMAYYANKFGYQDEVERLIGPCKVMTLEELDAFENINSVRAIIARVQRQASERQP